MRTERIVLSLALSLGGGAVIQSAAFAEEYRGTYEQQMACTPDVWRLCSDQIPDVGRIVACLRQNTPQLSGACRAVFESSNAVPPPGRPVPPRPYYDYRVQPRPYDNQFQPGPYEDDD